MARFDHLEERDKGWSDEVIGSDLLNGVYSAPGSCAANTRKNTWQTAQVGGSTVQLEKNANKETVSKVCTGADGYETVEKFNRHKQLTELDIRDPSGAVTSLHKVRIDEDNIRWLGQRKDKAGNSLEDVEKREGYLFFFDTKTHHLQRALAFNSGYYDWEPSTITPGQYDADRGSFSCRDESGRDVVRYLSTHREDVVNPEPAITLAGPSGILTKSGSASVSHEDGSGISLFDDSEMVRRDEGSSSLRIEALTPAEITYLERHASSVDRRDFAEIHFRFSNNKNELTNFYNNLSKFDSVPTFSASRKAAIQAGLMHDVAVPADISRGYSGSCSVSQIERELAVSSPSKLAQTVYDEAVLGKVTGASGKTFALDRANLLIDESTARPLASRIFQGAALQIEFQKKGLQYRNSQYGVETLKDGKGNKMSFPGVSFYDSEDLGYELTGKPTPVKK